MKSAKKAPPDSESNTIIKIKLSDMFGPPKALNLEEEPRSSIISSQEEVEEDIVDSPSDEEPELSNENLIEKQNLEEGMDEDLSSLHSSSNLSLNSRQDLPPSSVLNEEKNVKDIFEEEKNNLKAENIYESGLSIDTDLKGKTNKHSFKDFKDSSNNLDQIQNTTQSQFWKYRKQNKIKQNNVLVDYTNTYMNHADNIRISIERASSFNDNLLKNRKKIKDITKNLERQKLAQRFALDNSNCVFPSLFIPLLRYEDGKKNVIYENNGCLELEKDSLQKFIDLNVANEHSTFDHPSKYAMFYQKRFPRKRRRRRNANKHLNDGAPVNEEANKN